MFNKMIYTAHGTIYTYRELINTCIDLFDTRVSWMFLSSSTAFVGS